MKRILVLLFIVSLLPFTSLYAQVGGKKPLTQKNYANSNASGISVGVKAGGVCNDLIYSSVKQAKARGLFGPIAGIAFEWNASNVFSVGFDALYAVHGGRKAIDSEFQTSFTETNTAQVDYRMTMNCVDFRIPLTCYLGYESDTRAYCFIAPNFSLVLNGNIEWHRTYLNENAFVNALDYEVPLTKANARPYEISVVAGIGVCRRFQINQLKMLVKVDLAYDFGLMNDFSDAELNHEVTFVGWGGSDQESLGTRHMQALELKASLMIPIKKPLKDACVRWGEYD